MSQRDSDPITVCKKGPDDFVKMTIEIFSDIQYKLFFLIFIVFIILNSDVFINRILGKFSNSIDGHRITSWGTILQGTFLVLGAIAIDALVKNNIV
jgi:hypothetical protein